MAGDDDPDKATLLPWIAVLSLAAMLAAGALELLPGRRPPRKIEATEAVETVASENEIRTWPEEIRRDVEQGRVRVGFSVKQMGMAKATEANPAGRPLALYPDGDGKGDAWVYEEHTFIVRGGQVVEIVPTFDMKPLPRTAPRPLP